jgi:uncharacterized damage-inducible protein DinB
MTSEEAVFLRNYLIRQIEHERATTQRVLEALPEERREYRPHTDARSAIELAWHLANCEIWFLEGIIHGEFAPEHVRMPKHIRTVRDVIAWYENNVPGLIAEVKNLSPDQLTRRSELLGQSSYPAVTYLSALLVHTAHHRGQLAAYLRAMGARVPSIYGGSADEPFRAAAH